MAQHTSTSTSTLSPNEPSICIPRVHKSFSDGMIIEGMNQLGYGEVEKVDMIHKTDANDNEYYMVFIHFKHWNTDEETSKQREAFMRGEKQKIVYEEETGAYWILSKSYAKRREERGKKFQQGKSKTVPNAKTKAEKPYVDVDGWTSVPIKKHRANKKY
jgi:hypothetical protein